MFYENFTIKASRISKKTQASTLNRVPGSGKHFKFGGNTASICRGPFSVEMNRTLHFLFQNLGGRAPDYVHAFRTKTQNEFNRINTESQQNRTMNDNQRCIIMVEDC